jgi:hypothetical protein
MVSKIYKAKRIIHGGYVIAASMLFLFTFLILTTTSLWACKGVTHSGYHVSMKMLDPNTGDLFATITFDEVKEEGITTISKSNDILPAPSRFTLDKSAVYYDIASVAEYSGQVKICVNYKTMGFSNATGLRVSHFTDNSWNSLKTTLNQEKNIICGTAQSLSNFSIYKDSRLLYGPGFWYHNSYSRR